MAEAQRENIENVGNVGISDFLDDIAVRSARIKRNTEYSSQFVECMREAGYSSRLVANQLAQIVSLNVNTNNELLEFKEEIMVTLENSEAEHLEQMEEIMGQVDSVFAQVERVNDLAEETATEIRADMDADRDTQEEYNRKIEGHNKILDYTNDQNAAEIEEVRETLDEVQEKLDKETLNRKEQIDELKKDTRKRNDALKKTLLLELKEKEAEFDIKLALAKKESAVLVGDAKKTAEQEIAKLIEKQAALKEDIKADILAGNAVADAKVKEIEAKVEAAAEVSAANNAEIEKQVRRNAAAVARHSAQILDLDMRLKKLEMGLDDGSVVKVILDRGSYYLKCEKHAEEGKEIVWKTTGSDGNHYGGHERGRSQFVRAGQRTRTIPKGRGSVEDEIVIKDTSGKTTKWKITFRRGGGPAILEKLTSGSHGGSLLKNNTSNYSHIINPLNGRFVDITSRLGNKILKNYIKALI